MTDKIIRTLRTRDGIIQKIDRGGGIIRYVADGVYHPTREEAAMALYEKRHGRNSPEIKNNIPVIKEVMTMNNNGEPRVHFSVDGKAYFTREMADRAATELAVEHGQKVEKALASLSRHVERVSSNSDVPFAENTKNTPVSDTRESITSRLVVSDKPSALTRFDDNLTNARAKAFAQDMLDAYKIIHAQGLEVALELRSPILDWKHIQADVFRRVVKQKYNQKFIYVLEDFQNGLNDSDDLYVLYSQFIPALRDEASEAIQTALEAAQRETIYISIAGGASHKSREAAYSALVSIRDDATFIEVARLACEHDLIADLFHTAYNLFSLGDPLAFIANITTNLAALKNYIPYREIEVKVSLDLDEAPWEKPLSAMATSRKMDL